MRLALITLDVRLRAYCQVVSFSGFHSYWISWVQDPVHGLHTAPSLCVVLPSDHAQMQITAINLNKGDAE